MDITPRSWNLRAVLFFVLALGAILHTACASIREPLRGSGGSGVTIRTLRRGSMPHDSGLMTARNEADFRALWVDIHSNESKLPPLPEIDFDREMAIAIFRGCHSNTCYRVEIKDATISGDSMTVWVKETDPGADCYCGQAITCPVHLVAVPRVEGEVHQRTSRVTESCSSGSRR